MPSMIVELLYQPRINVILTLKLQNAVHCKEKLVMYTFKPINKSTNYLFGKQIHSLPSKHIFHRCAKIILKKP